MADVSHLSSSGPPGCLRTSLQAVVSSVVEHKLLLKCFLGILLGFFFSAEREEEG